MTRRLRLKLALHLIRWAGELIRRYAGDWRRIEAASDNLGQAEIELATYLDREGQKER
jgi:hypothetical protein